MPRSIFAAIWQRLQAGAETFAVLKNRSSDGMDYWTFAQFSPCRDATGRVTGYHTVQRGISPTAVAEIAPLYQRLRQAEIAAGANEPGLQAGNRVLDHQDRTSTRLNSSPSCDSRMTASDCKTKKKYQTHIP